MKIDNLIDGLRLPRYRSEDFTMEVVPQAFPSGAPDHSNKCYVCVEAFIVDDDAEELKRLGWVSESSGEVWCWRNF